MKTTAGGLVELADKPERIKEQYRQDPQKQWAL